MGLFGRKKCARCSTPLDRGSDVCPYCNFDPAASVVRSRRKAEPTPSPKAAPGQTVAPDLHEFEAAPPPRRDPDPAIAPEVEPARDQPTSQPKPLPAAIGPWGAVDERDDDLAPEAEPWRQERRGGPWEAGDPEETALEAAIRNNPKLNGGKKRINWVFVTMVLIFLMIFRVLFSAP